MIFFLGCSHENLIFLLLFPETENGLLSYENPNYHLDPKSIKHNQNLFEEIMSESKQRGTGESKVIMSNRKGYACLDIGSMGVDLKENFE
jgi:amyloid beta (A4) precursor protein-binding family B protein 2 (Fe65-like)